MLEPLVPVALLPDVPDEDEPLVPIDEPDVEPEPLVPDVDEPGGVLFMPAVPLAPRQVSVPVLVLVPPVLPLVPLLPLLVRISVELEPAVPLAPEVLVSWLPVLRCFDLADLSFLVSLDLCWSLPEVGELVVWAATPALTNRAARITASLLFMSSLLFCLWVQSVNCHSGTAPMHDA
ncbi:hypothetical protein [Pseudoduganella umbonata]|uniref:hypothetical protein n=1 Tax=Pseudoduganella umbonata TaxID=864828 RepID=UPI0016133BD4|nr:hypothetical protein [Pseudoduganella umbonata]